MAYILGFIVADGNLQKDGNYVKIEISPKDVEVLNFICEQITPGYQLKQSRPTEIRWYPASATLKSDLMLLGVRPAKTGREVVPLMPKKFMWDFIRGYFDGDGSVSDSFVATTCNSKNFLLSLRDFADLGYICKNRMNHNWVIEKKNEMWKFYQKIYATGDFSLNRKKSKLKFILSYKPDRVRISWDQEEDEYLREHRNFRTRLELAVALNRSVNCVKNRLRKLRIRKAVG